MRRHHPSPDVDRERCVVYTGFRVRENVALSPFSLAHRRTALDCAVLCVMVQLASVTHPSARLVATITMSVLTTSSRHICLRVVDLNSAASTENLLLEVD